MKPHYNGHLQYGTQFAGCYTEVTCLQDKFIKLQINIVQSSRQEFNDG